MSRAEKLIESSQTIDEGIAKVKKKIRETLHSDMPGSKGIRALAEIGLERTNKMLDKSDKDAPNGQGDDDDDLLTEAQKMFKETAKRLKKVKENKANK